MPRRRPYVARRNVWIRFAQKLKELERMKPYDAMAGAMRAGMLQIGPIELYRKKIPSRYMM